MVGMARELILRGAFTNLQGTRNQTALHVAVKNGIFSFLSFKKILYEFIFVGHEDMVRLLVEKGSFVNNRAIGFETPLICAIENGKYL